MIRILIGAFLLGLAAIYWIQPPGVASTPLDDPPVELGVVQWTRDLAKAKRTSEETGKPVFVLFQEVPGCETCQNFGNGPMSHPLLVEAIEELFVPVLVYNNKPSDEKLLQTYNEPSWNNPVVRYLDSSGKDVIQRKDSIWTISGTATRMIDALRHARRPVPQYLQLIAAEDRGETERATFAMHCYWEGEANLGLLDGVIQTRSAWLGDKEVVHVTYDPDVVGFGELLKSAQSMECASHVFAHDDVQLDLAKKAVGELATRLDAAEKPRDAKASEQQYYLRNSAYQYLPLTSLQTVRVNGALGKKADPKRFLSPRQVALYAKVKSVVSRTPTSLSEFSVLDSELPLATYQKRLEQRLAKIAN